MFVYTGDSVKIILDRKRMCKCEKYSFETGWGPVAGPGGFRSGTLGSTKR